MESNVNASDSDNLGHAMNANAPLVNPRVSHIANDVNRGYRSHTPPPQMDSPVAIEIPGNFRYIVIFSLFILVFFYQKVIKYHFILF